VATGRRGVVLIVALVAAFFATTIVATGLFVGVRALADSPESAPTPPDGAPKDVLAPVADDAKKPAADGVAKALEPLLSDGQLGPVGVSVVDVATGKSLFGAKDAEPATPASNTKLLTATAALAALGPDKRLTTKVVEGAQPGEVVLVGGGDVTLARDGDGLVPGAARVDKLAEAVKKKLGSTKPTKVVVDGSLFTGPTLGPGWGGDIVGSGNVAPITAVALDGGRRDPDGNARSSTPDIAAGTALADKLGVTAPVTAGKAPDGAKDIASVKSPPVRRLVEVMLAASDNTMAEALARQVAVERNQPVSFEGAATAVRDAVAPLLKEQDVAADQVAPVDGSGLANGNKVSPRALTALLVAAAGDKHRQLRTLLTGLAVAGYSGTLFDRFDGDSSKQAVGLVRGKTGTLTGVSALAGVVVDKDGRQLAFALLADKVPGSTDAAELVLDKIAATIASCGCQ
jgi:D-alanyl-D-alanine carboxypeptidase/D-alanyl-D-alanine-endopeptidase (penicillin-binding protein 4)